MGTEERSREYIYQGILQLLNPEQTTYRMRLSFCDPVEPELLQKALDRTLDKLPYFRLSLRGDENDLYHVRNDRPCLVYPEGEERKIPEETDGYLFYISYEGCSVTFRFLHFLTDGLGGYQFMVRLTGEYCRARYGIDFPDTPYPEEPPFTPEDLEPYSGYDSSNDRRDWLDGEIFRPESENILLRLDKSSVIALAKEKNAKPFSCLLTLFCAVAQRSLRTEKVNFEYPVSVRQAVGHPNALYNCAAIFTDTVSSGQEQSFDRMLSQIDGNVRRNLLPENTLKQVSQLYGLMNDVYSLSAPLSIKKRVFKMTLGGGLSAFMLTYCGKLPLTDAPEVERYLTDFCIDSCPEQTTPMFISVAEFADQWNCEIWHRYPNDDLPEILRSVMEEHNIRINEMRL